MQTKCKVNLDAELLNETKRGNFLMLKGTFHNKDKTVMNLFASQTIPDHETINITINLGIK